MINIFDEIGALVDYTFQRKLAIYWKKLPLFSDKISGIRYYLYNKHVYQRTFKKIDGAEVRNYT